jgi:hypothetical protein
MEIRMKDQQPDELEHRDPGYSCDSELDDRARILGDIQRPDEGDAKYPFVNDRGDTVLGPETLIEPNRNVVWVAGEKFIRFTIDKEVKRRMNERYNRRLGLGKSTSQVIQGLTDQYREALANGCQPTDRIALSLGEVEQLILSKFTEYPHDDGEVVVLGPEIFVNVEAEVICWRGENWVKQPDPQAPATAVSEPSWQQREALEFAIRVAAPASSTQRPVDRTVQVLDTADKILEWLLK